MVFDTETTGIEFGRDRIIEIGAVALEEQRGARGISTPLIRLPAGTDAADLHYSSSPALRTSSLDREGVDDRAAAEGFCRLLEGAERPLLVAYNAQFDLNFLYYLLKPAGVGVRFAKAAVFGCPDGVPRPAGLSPQAVQRH